MTHRTREQYERWHLGECVRCGRRAAKSANWEGLICRTCCEKAARTFGTCPGCGIERLLPGRRDGAPVCRDCAGITRDFHCDRCGNEAHLLGRRLCERCTLSDQLAELLDDGTGRRIAPGLAPLHAMLIQMPRPKSRLIWLRRTTNQALLTDLADGTLPLTHEAFHRHPEWRTAAHLRDLLMACGLLPERDGRLLRFESRLHRRLTELADHPHHQTLEHFATWHQLPKLRARATRKPLTDSAGNHAAQQFNRAHEFLTWLHQNQSALAQLTQAHLDRWHATHPSHEQRSLRGFLTWATSTGRAPRHLSLPRLHITEGRRLTQHRRLELLRRVLDETAGPVPARAAASLMLLYAQPASRLVQLTTDDVLREDNDVLIRLGDPPTPVPAPFSDLLLRAKNASTDNGSTASWLFPSRAGRPLHSRSLADQVRRMGIPGAAGRVAALRQLVLQAPAPVIAQALGFHDKTTTQLAAQAGGAWNRYAPDDHRQ
ncbi:hypothetical protein [Actinomadura formosensis]|uniref:hypothetical protein n=2 Tax=Actinomadura formosensis TaxID=60706 RepID=UPI003D939DA8